MKCTRYFGSASLMVTMLLMPFFQVDSAGAKGHRRSAPDLRKTIYTDPSIDVMQRILLREHGKIHTLRFSSGVERSQEVIDLARRVLLTRIDTTRELSFFMPSINSIYLAEGEDSHFELRRLLAMRELDQAKQGDSRVPPDDNLIRYSIIMSNCKDESRGTVIFKEHDGDTIDYKDDTTRFGNMKCNSLVAEYVMYLNSTGDTTNFAYERRVDLRLKAASLRGFRADGYAYGEDDSGTHNKDWVYEFVHIYDFALDTDLLEAHRFLQDGTYPSPGLEQCSVSTSTSKTTGWSIGVDASVSAESRKPQVGVSLGGSFTHSEETSESAGVSCDLTEYKIIAAPAETNNHFSVIHELNKLGHGDYSRAWTKSKVSPETYAALCDKGANHLPSDVNCHGDSRGAGCEGDYDGNTCCEYQNDKGEDFCKLSIYDTLPLTVTAPEGYNSTPGAYISLRGDYEPDLVAEDTLRASIRMEYYQGFRAWHQHMDNREMWKRKWESFDIADTVIHFPDVVVDWRDQRLFSLKTMSISNFATGDMIADKSGAPALIDESEINTQYAAPFPLQNEHVFYPYQIGNRFFDGFQIRRYDASSKKRCLGVDTGSAAIGIVDCESPGGYSLVWEVKAESPAVASDQICLTQDPNLCLAQHGTVLGLLPPCEGSQAGCDPQKWKLSDALSGVSYCNYLELQYGGSCY